MSWMAFCCPRCDQVVPVSGFGRAHVGGRPKGCPPFLVDVQVLTVNNSGHFYKEPHFSLRVLLLVGVAAAPQCCVRTCDHCIGVVR